MSEPDEFFESPQFAETLKLLKKSPAKLPVKDSEFLTELWRYSNARISEAPGQIGGVLEQLKLFVKRQPKVELQLALVLTEHEAYVDMKRGDFEATLFMFDPNDASRSEFKALKSAREWADDEVDECKWGKNSVPASFVLHAANLITVAIAARALVKSMKDYSGWSFRIEKGDSREFVCDWHG